MLSRNFRMQKVGNIDWLNKNYNFSTIASSIDELIILNTDPLGDAPEEEVEQFCRAVEKVTAGCFMPLALGGNVFNLGDIQRRMQSGADKVVINTALFEDPDFVKAAVAKYGSQCVIASVDYRRAPTDQIGFEVLTHGGHKLVKEELTQVLKYIADLGVGEIYLNSIDKDGTGQGYCMDVLGSTSSVSHLPIIMSGGAGNFEHFIEGLECLEVDAVATANLFNFVGNGLPSAREKLLANGHMLAVW